ncbi:MAG TPA: hypothetical protein VFC46_09605 [Humisphaera sp.]|nr:hypothetical protein [Humisphaera sp.]
MNRGAPREAAALAAPGAADFKIADALTRESVLAVLDFLDRRT